MERRVGYFHYPFGSKKNSADKAGERILKGGRTGFDIESPPRLVGGLSGKKMKQIASGNQHSLAMDEEGYVYAWGYAGYSRLGLQDQKDR